MSFNELPELRTERATVSAAMSAYAAGCNLETRAHLQPELRAEFAANAARLAAVDAQILLARRATIRAGGAR